VAWLPGGASGKAGTAPVDRRPDAVLSPMSTCPAVVIALLAVLGVDLIVLDVFPDVVLGRSR